MRFVEVDFRIALVGGDDEAMPVRELEQESPVVQGHHAPGGIVRRARVDELGARPYALGYSVPARRIAVLAQTVDAMRDRPGENRRAFVDLVERIGHHDRSTRATPVDDGLREREERLAASQDRQ